jgi:hypothetical protein
VPKPKLEGGRCLIIIGTEGEAAKTAAVTRMVAWQLIQEMERQGMTKAELAEKMNTSTSAQWF